MHAQAEQAERIRAVELMLRDLLSYLPRAKQPSDLLAATSGLAPGRSMPCSACNARGRVLEPGKVCIQCPPRLGPKAPPVAFFVENKPGDLTDRVSTRHGCKPCLNCGGSGWKKIHVPKSKVGTDYDEYSGGRHSERLAARDSKPWQREQDTARQLRQVEHALALWEKPDTVEEVWEERRKTQWGSGSYKQLMHALGYLERNWPRRFSLVWRVYVLEEPITVSDTIAARLEETLEWLAKLMPKTILVPAHIASALNPEETNAQRKASFERGRTPAHARERAKRDEEIRRLRLEENWKVTRLARHFVLSERQILKIMAVPSTATVAA